jgi:hypothetical protein
VRSKVAGSEKIGGKTAWFTFTIFLLSQMPLLYSDEGDELSITLGAVRPTSLTKVDTLVSVLSTDPSISPDKLEQAEMRVMADAAANSLTRITLLLFERYEELYFLCRK